MREGTPAYSAEITAMHRAHESRKPEQRRVCYDPFAEAFLGARHKAITKIPLLADFAYWLLVERRFPGTAGQVVVRTRYIDDYLKQCIRDGISQLVILGAGYDTRPYRFEELKGRVKVFEVDHPSTQKAKTERLKKIFGSLPNHVVYVPIDFDREKFDQRLFEGGYGRSVKTLFIWEGVTMYLTAEAVDETLAFVVNNSGDGSSIILNYVYKSIVDGTCELEGAKKHLQLMAKTGELFTFGVDEGAIDDFLGKRGFHQINNATPEFLKKAYFKGNSRERKLCLYLPIVHASVKPRA